MRHSFLLILYCEYLSLISSPNSLVSLVCGYESPSEYTLSAIVWEVAPTAAGFTSVSQFSAIQGASALRLAVEKVNASPDILPNTTLSLNIFSHFLSSSAAIQAMMEFSANDQTLVVGNPLSDISIFTGIVGTVFDVAQLSGSATSSRLSDELSYPLFSRLVAPSATQSSAMKDLLLYYSELSGRGWTDVAIISTTDEYGVNLATNLIDIAGNDLTILTYQQFILEEESNFEVELTEIERSGARVIFAYVFSGFDQLIIAANEKGLVGDQYVWIVPDTVVGLGFTSNSTSPESQLARGTLGDFIYVPTSGALYDEFIADWFSANPFLYPGAGLPDFPPTPYSVLAYETGIASALMIEEADRRELLDGRRISGKVWTELARDFLNYEGVSGHVDITENGDRVTSYFMLNFIPETNSWLPFGIWSPEVGFTPLPDTEPIWFSNTTDIPDLDIRPPFGYWSCDEKESGFDSTGKEIRLETPDSDPNFIKSSYFCDQFIDCRNMSDEGSGCNQNYIVLFIIFGILTGLLVLITISVIVFVIIFGVCLHYRRLRVASPIFLVIILFAILFGFLSIFAWFGKPHPVSCAFQPWLLGLPAIAMTAALTVKAFRIWRIFRFPLKRTKVTDLELFILWVILMFPAFFIVVAWTIISTPTAEVREVDGVDHYVCATGGFTGAPGGYVFFGILVAYGAFILVLGAAASIATRNVPSQFNESKLIAISIYNLGFLSIVIIPVFLVINPFNPFLAWILRSLAILYAFTATLLLQFLPRIWGIVLTDRGKNLTNYRAPKSSSALPPEADSSASGT